MSPIRFQAKTHSYQKQETNNWVAFQPSPNQALFLTILTRHKTSKPDGYKYLTYVQRVKYAFYGKLDKHLNQE